MLNRSRNRNLDRREHAVPPNKNVDLTGSIWKRCFDGCLQSLLYRELLHERLQVPVLWSAFSRFAYLCQRSNAGNFICNGRVGGLNVGQQFRCFNVCCRCLDHGSRGPLDQQLRRLLLHCCFQRSAISLSIGIPQKRPLYAPEFVAYVDALIRDVPLAPASDRAAQFNADVAELKSLAAK